MKETSPQNGWQHKQKPTRGSHGLELRRLAPKTVGDTNKNLRAAHTGFIWFVGVHLSPSWPAHTALSGLLGSILANLGCQPMPFYLACLGPSWSHLGPGRAVFGFSVSILSNFGAAHAVLSAFLGSILGNFKPFWASPCRYNWFVTDCDRGARKV